MQLVGVQLDIAWEDRESNFKRVGALLEKHPPRAGALLALPEMFTSGFSMNVEAIAEDESRATERFLCDLSRQFGITIVGGLATIGPDAKGRNEAVVLSPGGQVSARYQKIHPFVPGKEGEHYRGGSKIITFARGEFTAAPFVCYDLRFPEIFRAGMQRGANLMIIIANWPSTRIEHWRTLLRARAIENQCYVLGVNRCGNDPFLNYPGRSAIIDYAGKVIVEADAVEQIIAAEIELAPLLAYRAQLPFLSDATRDLSGLWE